MRPGTVTLPGDNIKAPQTVEQKQGEGKGSAEEASLHEGGGLSIGPPSQRAIRQWTNPLLVRVHHVLHLIQTQCRSIEDQDPRYDAINVANSAMYNETATAPALTSTK